MINYLPVKKNGKSTTDFLGEIVLGADYFFNSHFSVGVQSQFNTTDSDIISLHFGNTGNINFNTATILTQINWNLA
jgi:hypothetical protein